MKKKWSYKILTWFLLSIHLHRVCVSTSFYTGTCIIVFFPQCCDFPPGNHHSSIGFVQSTLQQIPLERTEIHRASKLAELPNHSPIQESPAYDISRVDDLVLHEFIENDANHLSVVLPECSRSTEDVSFSLCISTASDT